MRSEFWNTFRKRFSRVRVKRHMLCKILYLSLSRSRHAIGDLSTHSKNTQRCMTFMPRYNVSIYQYPPYPRPPSIAHYFEVGGKQRIPNKLIINTEIPSCTRADRAMSGLFSNNSSDKNHHLPKAHHYLSRWIHMVY